MTFSDTSRLLRVVSSGAVTLLLMASGAGCGSDRTASDSTASDRTASDPAGSASARQSPSPPLTAGPPSEEELAPGWDEPGDSPSPEPVEELSDDALLRLLRTRAAVSGGPDTCDPDAVEAALVGFDVALGHRYTSLRVRNTSEESCQVEGVPGVGARGQWGSAFKLTVQPAPPDSEHRGPVTLAPGQEAVAVVEWTGMLAGAEDEKAATLVVQLAEGQVPVVVPARLEHVPAGAEPLDVGMMTTLRVSPFVPGVAGR